DAAIARALFSDPNSRFQRGGTGYLRVPLDEARIMRRLAAPDWLDRRGDFIRTLKASRAARAEQILSAFYIDGKTDMQIAQIIGWRKHSVKSERVALIRKGNAFFHASGSDAPLAPL